MARRVWVMELKEGNDSIEVAHQNIKTGLTLPVEERAMVTSKEDVRDFWDKAACGEKLYLEGMDLEGFSKQAKTRYELEPFMKPSRRIPRPVDGDECGAGVWGCNPLPPVS